MERMYLSNGVEVPNKRAIIRKDTERILGVVGSRYQPLQNRSAFSFFDGVFGDDKARYESAGVLGDGERVWMRPALSDQEAELDRYIERAIKVDPDIWVVEIEDRTGRHFLTEPVEQG